MTRECASSDRCELQIIFEADSHQVNIFPQSQRVFVNGQSFTAAQLASAEAFGGTVKVLIVGDVIELAYNGQQVRLILTKNSIKTVVDGRFSNHLMGLCGKFNYDRKDDLTNAAGMIVDNAKLFGDGWALPPSPGAICVSHSCNANVSIEAMNICSKLRCILFHVLPSIN